MRSERARVLFFDFQPEGRVFMFEDHETVLHKDDLYRNKKGKWFFYRECTFDDCVEILNNSRFTDKDPGPSKPKVI